MHIKIKQMQEIIEKTKDYIRELLYSDSTGHDWFHVERVWKLSKSLAEKEGGLDMFVVEMGALLHDIADHKFYAGDENIGHQKAAEYLEMIDATELQKHKIVEIVKEISFKGLGVSTPMSSKEGEVIQDADRLDAIGAIGIARTFAYGGSKNRQIYDPSVKPVCHDSFTKYKQSKAPTINHFYEKLLHLKDRMNTESAKKEAVKRHAFMEDFLRNFYTEWEEVL